MWLPLAAAAILVIGILFGASLRTDELTMLRLVSGSEVEANAHGVGPIEEILRYIEAKYVDEIDRDQLIDGAVNNLLAELDPHSTFVPADALVRHRAQLEGSATGIGIDVLIINDSVTVVSALPGGPADIAGLQAYDRIISVADSVVSGKGLTSSGIEKWMLRLGDEAIKLEVYRPHVGMLAPVSLSRAKVVVPSVAKGVLLEQDVAYIKVRQFGTNTYEEFMQELEKLVDQQKARHLIIDLRGNSGGYLNEAVQLLSQLFPQEGKLLVYTEGAHSARKEYKSTGRIYFPVDQVAVIIDQGSASASEIIAGAVQDWDRGTIVGKRSFGKGLVQELYPLKDGGALHMTVSRYFTPSGRSIQRDYEDLGAYRPAYVDSLQRAEGNVFVTSGGRKVFGGGGIAPDYEVNEKRSIDAPAFAPLLPYIENFGFEHHEELQAESSREALLPTLRADFTKAGFQLSDSDWAHYEADLMRELSFYADNAEGKPSQRARIEADAYVQAALKAVRTPQARSL